MIVYDWIYNNCNDNKQTNQPKTEKDRHVQTPMEICATPDRDRAIVFICKDCVVSRGGKQSSVLFNESA